jgi:hypothetical protein
MKKTFERAAAWLRGMRRRRAERRKAAAECRMLMDARRAVQVREFGGEVFVCMDGVPMLPVDGLKWDLPTVLDVSREAYVKYMKEECGDGR